MHVYIDFVGISKVTSSCSISLNVGIVICIVSSVSGHPVNKIAKKKKKKNLHPYNMHFKIIFQTPLLVFFSFLFVTYSDHLRTYFSFLFI